jgi:hypothetical protein
MSVKENCIKKLDTCQLFLRKVTVESSTFFKFSQKWVLWTHMVLEITNSFFFSTVIVLCTGALTFNNSEFFPQSVFMSFVDSQNKQRYKFFSL